MLSQMYSVLQGFAPAICKIQSGAWHENEQHCAGCGSLWLHFRDSNWVERLLYISCHWSVMIKELIVFAVAPFITMAWITGSIIKPTCVGK